MGLTSNWFWAVLRTARELANTSTVSLGSSGSLEAAMILPTTWKQGDPSLPTASSTRPTSRHRDFCSSSPLAVFSIRRGDACLNKNWTKTFSSRPASSNDSTKWERGSYPNSSILLISITGLVTSITAPHTYSPPRKTKSSLCGLITAPG